MTPGQSGRLFTNIPGNREKPSAGPRNYQVLKAFTNPNRILILFLLTAGEHSVGQMIDKTGLSQSNMSHHLAILRRLGVVTTRRKGRTIFYSRIAAQTEPLMGCLRELFGI